jgi:hypothetical protein
MGLRKLTCLVNDDEQETTGVLRTLHAAKIRNISCQSQIILHAPWNSIHVPTFPRSIVPTFHRSIVPTFPRSISLHHIIT